MNISRDQIVHSLNKNTARVSRVFERNGFVSNKWLQDYRFAVYDFEEFIKSQPEQVDYNVAVDKVSELSSKSKSEAYSAGCKAVRNILRGLKGVHSNNK